MKKHITAITLILSISAALIIPVNASDNLPKAGETVQGFTVDEITESKALNSDIILMSHKKTGAQVLYIANDDNNRAFDIAFNTPASDTGISHVFEHATLGGSEKYPADLFFALSRKTAATFMNAMTSTSYTYYPLSSVSDEQLLRLADYYLDSVFNPLIKTDKSIFDTEAWRYELQSPDDELTLNGTVYSEMKGSVTPDNRAYFSTLKTLFPNSNKAAISGGDPDIIPSLTYDEVVKYHDEYYKPSNSLAILYGDVDYKEYLELLDSYFSKYDSKKPDISDKDYKPISGHIEKQFKIGGANTIIFYAIPCPIDTDSDLFGLMMCGNLFNLQSSEFQQKIKAVLPNANVTAGLDTNFAEPILAFKASNIDESDKDLFKSIVDESINEIMSNGFDEAVIDAYSASFERSILLSGESAENIGINNINNINNMWSALGDPLEYFDYLDYVFDLKENTSGNKLETLLEKYVVNSDRSALVVNVPDENLAAEKETALKNKLADIKSKMTDEEINEIVKRTTESNKENPDADNLVKKINVSNAENLKKELDNYKTKEYPHNDENIDGVRHITANADIGNIGIGRIYLDISALTDEQLMYFALYDNLIGMFPSKNYSQSELYNLLARYIDGGSKLLPADDKLYYTFNMTMLNDDIEKSYEILYELLFNSDVSDTETLKALVNRMLAGSKSNALNDPQSVILSRARAQKNEKAAVYEYTSGLTYLEFLEKVSKELEENPQAVVEKMNDAVKILRNKYNASSVFAGNDAGIELYKKASEKFFKDIPYEERAGVKRNIPVPQGNEAIIIPSEVNYNLIAAPLDEIGADRDGELYVTEKIVEDKLLIPQLRYIKGAYGTSYDVNEYGMYIASYRDPQLRDTFDYFNALGGLINDMPITKDELDGYIVSSFVNTAKMRGRLNDTYHYLTTLVYTSEKDGYEKLKEQLDTTEEMVRDYSSVYDALAKSGVKYTIGKESDIIENADLFDTILIPFGGDDICIYADGKKVESDTAPVIKNDRALVPIRVISEALGAEVEWDDENKSVTITLDAKTILLNIGSSDMKTEGKTISLDTAPELINDRTMVPIRAVSEAFDKQVDWKTGCIVIK